MRNYEYCIDRTAGEAIRRVDQDRRKKRIKTWNGRLTYRIGEVMDPEFRIVY